MSLSQHIEPKILNYCRYQERCHMEVRSKLYDMGFHTPEVERQLSALIETGELNEERFARAYARGKFRMLHWGRVKIKQGLKARSISDYCIRKAMLEINEAEYENTLNKISSKKWQETKADKSVLSRKAKVYRYLLQKGYEKDLVADAIINCIEKHSK